MDTVMKPGCSERMNQGQGDREDRGKGDAVGGERMAHLSS